MSDEGMRQKVAQTLGRRGFRPAFVTAAGIFAALIVTGFLLALLTTLSSVTLWGTSPDQHFYVSSIWTGVLVDSLTTSLPFAVGVLLSLWQVAPIGPELRLAHVVTRTLLASAVGTFCVIVVVVLLGLLGALAGVGPWFANSFPDLGSAFGGFWFAALNGVAGALRGLVQYSPIVVLGGVLLWGWLQRHPLKHDVSGTLDEV